MLEPTKRVQKIIQDLAAAGKPVEREAIKNILIAGGHKFGGAVVNHELQSYYDMLDINKIISNFKNNGEKITKETIEKIIKELDKAGVCITRSLKSLVHNAVYSQLSIHQSSPVIVSDDLVRAKEFVVSVGSIDRAKELLETIEKLQVK